jgi:hypothetical protein
MKTALIALIIMIALPLPGGDKDNTGWWLDNYRDYTQYEGKNDPRVKRAFAVFDRVKNAADKEIADLPHLAIISYSRGARFRSLPDGGIIINPVVLDICYGSDEPGKKADGQLLQEGDRRLAFILGHELAHLSNKDHRYGKALTALDRFSRGEKVGKELKRDLVPPPSRTQELLADPRGAIFAAMAGYDIGRLLEEKNNFLRRLAEETGIDYTDDRAASHPSLAKRYEFLRAQLRSVTSDLELFRAGVLLLHLGRKYDDSAAAFRKFSIFYPSREVYNNIGICYLNSALRYLRINFSDDYFRFRLATAVAYHTSAEKLYFRGEGDYLKEKDIYQCLEEAIWHFREAAHRDRRDRACRINLSAALILKKNYAGALAQCDFLLEKNPGDIEAMNNKAIALYCLGKELCNCAPVQAAALLKEALRAEPGNFEVFYNLAALAREMKKTGEANALWEKYLNIPGVPRDNFYAHTCEELGKKEQKPPVQSSPLPAAPKGIKIGKDAAPLLEKWNGETVSTYDLTSKEKGPEGWSIKLRVAIQKDQGRKVLIKGDFIVLVEQPLATAKNTTRLLERFGPPQKIIHHTAGNFYIYEDKGFSLKEVNGEICSYIWFKKGS